MSAEELMEATIALLEVGFSLQCCGVAACAIYTYDRSLTFGSEVNLIWRRRRMTVATGLYLLVHLSTTVYVYTQIAGTADVSCRSGTVQFVMQYCASVLFHVATGAFMALRAYAISNRSLPLAFAIFLSSLVIAALNIYQVCAVSAVAVPPPIGCVVSPDIKTSIRRPLLATGQASTVIPEVFLLVATWRHACVAKIANAAQIDTPLTTLFLRDGTVYFVIIFILRLVDALLVATTTAMDPFFSPITYALQAILLSRFYLNLHEANSFQATTPSSPSQMSSLRFMRVVGALAGSVAYDSESPAAEGTDVRSCSDPDTDEGSVEAQEPDVERLSFTAAVQGSVETSVPSGLGVVYVEEVPRVAFRSNA